MVANQTLLLSRGEVAALLSIDDCMNAVENAFRLHAEGKTMSPKLLGIHTVDGGFHIKAGIMGLARNYFVAKINANFPNNARQHNLPTIQGIVIVSDASDGRLLALIDSIEMTIIRTGAATAIAAKWLSRTESNVATICGCGNQGRISLVALTRMRKLEKLFAFDTDESQIRKFMKEFGSLLTIIPVSIDELSTALRQSDIVVTCTPSKKPFIHPKDIKPGTFIAAVGADSEEKQELFADLLVTNKLVVDIAEQSAAIGELHHAIAGGLITIHDIHAELGSIIAGKKAGRESDDEIIIFDSTGTALQDIAAAAIIYENAVAKGMGAKINFDMEETEYQKLKKTKRTVMP